MAEAFYRKGVCNRGTPLLLLETVASAQQLARTPRALDVNLNLYSRAHGTLILGCEPIYTLSAQSVCHNVQLRSAYGSSTCAPCPRRNISLNFMRTGCLAKGDAIRRIHQGFGHAARAVFRSERHATAQRAKRSTSSPLATPVCSSTICGNGLALPSLDGGRLRRFDVSRISPADTGLIPTLRNRTESESKER